MSKPGGRRGQYPKPRYAQDNLAHGRDGARFRFVRGAEFPSSWREPRTHYGNGLPMPAVREVVPAPAPEPVRTAKTSLGEAVLEARGKMAAREAQRMELPDAAARVGPGALDIIEGGRR